MDQPILNEVLFEEGELARRLNTRKINWPELVFYAEAEREPFANIHVVTLYSHCVGIALERMVGGLLTQGVTVLDADFSKKKYRDFLEDTLPTIKAREFVEVESDRVVVAVDRKTIDDFAIDRALEMIETIDDFAVGTNYEFGSYKQYEYQVDDSTERV